MNPRFADRASPAMIVLAAVSVCLASEERPRIISASRSLTRAVQSGRAEYTISVGGLLDAENTHVHRGAYHPLFQPNVELTITNTGDVRVVNPRITINGTGDWFDGESLARASVADAAGPGDEEKARALWDFFRRNIDEGPTYNEACWADTRSFVRFMNCFGSGACGTFHVVMPMVGRDAGLVTESGCLADCSHAVQRVLYGGRDHFLDALMSCGTSGPRGYVPLELDNQTVASIASIMDDHYLVERCGTWPGFYINVAYFGPGSSFHSTAKGGWREPRTMGMTLRPGESIRRTWRPVIQGWLEEAPSPVSSGEGQVMLRPRLEPAAVRRDARFASSVETAGGTLRTVGDGTGEIVYELYSPYVVIGCRMSAILELPAEDYEQARLQISFNDSEWHDRWRPSAGGRQHAWVEDRTAPAFHRPSFTHRVLFRLILPPKARASDLEMSLMFQAYVPSLPALRLGLNRIVYRDETPGSHALTIEHRWRESSQFGPPDAPPAAVLPPNDGEAGCGPTFKWTPPAGEIEGYEFYLSPRADLAWPQLAPFHVVVPGSRPEYTPPVADALSDAQRYYWRVRARSPAGVWSSWSPTWSFIARGPRSPKRLRVFSEAGREMLCWEPAAGGEPVAAYEVYGHSDDAVSPRREVSIGRVGKQEIELPTTLIAETKEAFFEVTGRSEAFYRVVARDAAGSRSVPTPTVAAPRPVWLPWNPPEIHPGAKVSLRPPVRLSTGKWVLSLRQGLIRHRADRPRFEMKEGPAWLSIHTDRGELSGTAPKDLVGSVTLRLAVSVDRVGSAEAVFRLPVR